MGSMSIVHWLIVLFVVIIIFGPKKLPELAKAVGESIKAFKKEVNNNSDQVAGQQQPPQQLPQNTSPHSVTPNQPTPQNKDNISQG
jgi:sec-independent protein translocase protein TatA